jgi:hypothetical protein
LLRTMSQKTARIVMKFIALAFLISVFLSINKGYGIGTFEIIFWFLFIVFSLGRLLFHKLVSNRRYKGDLVLNKQRSYLHLFLLALIVTLIPQIDYSYSIALSIAIVVDASIIHLNQPQALVIRNKVLINNYTIIPIKYPLRALTTIKKNDSNSRVKLIFENKYAMRINTRDLDQNDVNTLVDLLIQQSNPEIIENHFLEF